jgi:predicted ATPase/DNA-binding CsgD family transcriptional regulator/Tfp pilus assembly protein PilF
MAGVEIDVARRTQWQTLPRPLSRFVGREREVATVRELLDPRLAHDFQRRLVTLTGPGGCGKTRLALAVAADLGEAFADGVVFVSLAAVTEPDLVLVGVAHALGMREYDRPDAPLLERIAAHIGGREYLLVLDNVEQIQDAATLVAGLVAAGPATRVLVTSRAPLHVSGEQQFPIGPLEVPSLHPLPAIELLAGYAAIALFIYRAREARPDFELSAENGEAVAAICGRLDGLPLAIELAAARVNVLPPQALLARLEQRLPLLSGGPRDVPARLRTMRAAIAWSEQLLTPRERRLFRRLAVFAGGCTLAAAQAVCMEPNESELDILDSLAALVDQSLVLQRAGSDGEPRFTMLETIREYALEQLAASTEPGAVFQRYADLFVALAERAAPHIQGQAQELWAARLNAEHDNFRAVLARGGPPRVRIALALWKYWVQCGHCSEGRRWIGAALAGEAELSATQRAWLLTRATLLATEQTAYAEAQASGAEALALWRQLGNANGAAWTMIYLGLAAHRRGDDHAAELLLEEALASGRAAGDGVAVGDARNVLALVAWARGDLDRARALLEEVLVSVRKRHDRGAAAVVLGNLGDVARSRGDHASALAWYEQALAEWRTVGESLPGMRWLLLSLGTLAVTHGDRATAHTWLDRALDAARRHGDRRIVVAALIGRGRLALVEQDTPLALAQAQEALARAREMGTPHDIAAALRLVGVVAAKDGQPRVAARLCSAAEVWLGSGSGPPSPSDAEERAEANHSLAAARTALGVAAFDEACSAGRGARLEEAVQDGLTVVAAIASPSDSGRPVHANHLTTREMEVLRLLADGYSNRQIASTLVVSVRTVEHHVDGIFAKIGVHRRVDAVAYATRHRLLAPNGYGDGLPIPARRD